MVSTGSDNGLVPIWRQSIIYSNAWLLSIRSLGTNFSEILVKIRKNAFENVVCQNGGHFAQMEMT